MDIAKRFGATIDVDDPAPDSEGTFFVKRREDVYHEQFVRGLLGVLGTTDRLVLHHCSGFALVVLSYERAQQLQAFSWIETVGSVQFDAERFAAVLGTSPPA